jgi:hypothetical protein
MLAGGLHPMNGRFGISVHLLIRFSHGSNKAFSSELYRWMPLPRFLLRQVWQLEVMLARGLHPMNSRFGNSVHLLIPFPTGATKPSQVKCTHGCLCPLTYSIELAGLRQGNILAQALYNAY